MKSSAVARALQKLSSTKRAENNTWFFKTKPGEYGYGDQFWGLSVPQVRSVVKQYLDLPLTEIIVLLHHKVHEVRLCAVLLLVARYKEAPEAVFTAYLANAKHVNNWDLVDSSAPYIVGPFLQGKSKQILTQLAESRNLWERHIAVLATFYYINQGSSKEALHIATLLLRDEHDLIHKAVGWMLREIGKRCSQETEEEFLRLHARVMPRTMLRYALEHFSPEKRVFYMSLKNKP